MLDTTDQKKHQLLLKAKTYVPLQFYVYNQVSRNNYNFFYFFLM